MPIVTVKPVFKRPLKRRKIGFQDRLSLNAGQNHCRMQNAIFLTFIKLPFVIKLFVLSIFEWSLKTGFTVFEKDKTNWDNVKKLTISRVVAALRSARKQFSSSLKNVDWSSIPYTPNYEYVS